MLQRKKQAQLEYLSNHFPVVVIGGARQVGKSTLLKEFAKSKEKINYVRAIKKSKEQMIH